MEQALALDARNGNTFWADAISKEMENVRVAFEDLLDGMSAPIGHYFMQCIWCLISKFRISDKRPGLLQGTT